SPADSARGAVDSGPGTLRPEQIGTQQVLVPRFRPPQASPERQAVLRRLRRAHDPQRGGPTLRLLLAEGTRRVDLQQRPRREGSRDREEGAGGDQDATSIARARRPGRGRSTQGPGARIAANDTGARKPGKPPGGS